MSRGLKAQLKVFIAAISTIKTFTLYCLQDFFQSTTEAGIVAVFTKFPQKVGDLLRRENNHSLFVKDAVRFY